MSLLDVLKPRPEQLEAAARQHGRARTRMRLAHEGHRSERKKALLKLRRKRYRARHPGIESNIAKIRAWTAANPERARRAQQLWAQENKDRINAAAARYREKKRLERQAA